MPKASQTVEQFLRELEHPRKAEINALRALILGAHPGITEHVKWNAPSFCHDGVDRVTFRLQPGNRLQLVLHRGAKVRDDAAAFRFDDDSGLLDWVAPDRAVVTFRDLDDVATRRSSVADLIRRWVAA